MEDKKTYYTEDLVKEAIEELEDRIKWIKENEEEDHYEKIEDCIHEIADNNIPIYTYDLLQYASNNFDFIYANDLAGENADVVKIIQCNIYEYLTEKLYNHINTEITIKTKGE
tara:strand:+ start:39 stop:377 length:339 start_codon:yes stop_codon:yes gene_type:complete